MSKKVKKKTSNKKKKKTNKESNISIEVIGIIIIFISVIGVFRLGYIGLMLTNLFRFFVGNSTIIAFMIFIMYALYFIVKGKELEIPRNIFWSFLLAYITWLLMSDAMVFQDIWQQNETPIGATLNNFASDFQQGQIETDMAGGIIGALLYTGSHFLFAQMGTYAVIIMLAISSVLIFLQIGFSEVMVKVRESLLDLADVFVREDNGDYQYEEDEKYIEAEKERKAKKKNKTKSEKKTPLKNVSSVGQSLKTRSKQFLDVIFDDEELEADKANDGQQLDYEPELPIMDSFSDLEPFKDTYIPVEPPYPDFNESEAHPAIKDNRNSEDASEDTELGELNMGGTPEDDHYELPPLSLLNPVPVNDQTSEKNTVRKNMKILEQTFESFGVDCKVMDEPLLGPAVTKYEIKPAIGVKVSKIVNLSDDIALALAAKDIRIEAPIPGKPYVGIEVPNSKTSFVSFSDVIQASLLSPNKLDVPLGRDISGNSRLCDLTRMPHMLIAGSTGSGKSVCINGIITSILMKTKPHEVKLMMIDPKMVELNVYNGIPHLLTPVVTNPKKAAQALQKVVAEMEKRYELFASMGMRNIDGYNQHVDQYNQEMGQNNPKLPYIVVIVDELADLMMVASNEVEDAIIRLAQMARAAGIHMILATQRPSVDVITGIIKANVPSRIAFAVSSGTDSRTIIDANGAEKLLGRGDMLFMPMGENKPIRVQGAYITDEEVERVVEFVKNQQEVEYVEEMMPTDVPKQMDGEPEDELFGEALDLLKDLETVSTSFLQRKFRIGYNRAARMIDELEARGYIGPSEGSKPRKVNIQDFSEPEEKNENAETLVESTKID
ncbi:DNA segregation ATPase FtsK/SpoIIIE, S-DNA-T family [Granulicatella balaenopterae]|uniref:DNA translocase FtsK n=1 Tax=Granulicatella balaenopterae TaxID=137733 RepID=A0A1H9PPI6_9LACT|nr:DNA translocase FtsK [Granulicatella balaenopterae]SER50112.1 DNA segregation ATPase FtsK/SpoIIIE, S-DNA-T family [Granulicatella balaenopterae]